MTAGHLLIGEQRTVVAGIKAAIERGSHCMLSDLAGTGKTTVLIKSLPTRSGGEPS
jgi:hypothetical protein